MGPRDMENGTIELVRRDMLEKQTVSQEGLVERIEGLMTEIQENIYRKALNYRESMITKVDTWEEFKQVLDDKGGFLLAHWDGTVETEVAIKGGHEGHDPLHSDRRARRGGRMRLLRQAVAPPRAVRPQLLVCGVRDAARSYGISPANIRRGFFGRCVGWCRPCGAFLDGESGRKSDRRSCVSVNFTIFVHCRKNVRYVR